MATETYPEAMDFEFTHPQNYFYDKGFKSNSPPSTFKKQESYTTSSFPTIKKGPFEIPASFHNNEYSNNNDNNKNTKVVCDLMNHFSLEDKQDKQENVQKQDLFNEKNQVTVYSPPLTPKDTTTDNAVQCQCSIEQQQNNNKIPSPHYKNTYSPTIIYHQPPHISPEEQSKGIVTYWFGLLKLAITVIVFSVLMYMLAQVALHIRYDMKVKVSGYESDMLVDQSYCIEQYTQNRCSPETRLPAIVGLCKEWEQCMYRSISASKSRVMAEVIGEIINGFTSTLTLKAMVYTSLCGLCTIWAVSVFFKKKEQL